MMDSPKNVLSIFFENVCASPQLVALELNEQIWTYSELLTNVIRVTHHLDIEPGEIVYQYVDRSLEMVCGLLGILCAGGIYCSLNPSNPPAYIRSLLDYLPGRLVLVHVRTCDRFPGTSSQPMQLVDLEQIFNVDMIADVVEKGTILLLLIK
jgi:non-ribosomal peptide synthetase component F